MGTVNNEARDVAPSVTKQEMHAKQGNTILTPEFHSRAGQSGKMSFKRVMCPATDGKDTGRGEKKVKV